MFYHRFNLLMDRSPGFGSTSLDFSHVNTRFRFGSDPLILTSPNNVTRRFILQKARHHALTRSDFL